MEFLFLSLFLFFFLWPTMPTHCSILWHWRTHTLSLSLGRTPLDEGSARTWQHITLTSDMPLAGFQAIIPASVRPQTTAWHRAATGMGLIMTLKLFSPYTATVQLYSEHTAVWPWWQARTCAAIAFHRYQLGKSRACAYPWHGGLCYCSALCSSSVEGISTHISTSKWHSFMLLTVWIFTRLLVGLCDQSVTLALATGVFKLRNSM